MTSPALFALMRPGDGTPLWEQAGTISTRDWICGYCDRQVASDRGWTMKQVISQSRSGHVNHAVTGHLAICPNCKLPSLLSQGRQVPGAPYGVDVAHLPDDVAALYGEARRAIQAMSPTAAVMAGRKILAHVAVGKGADAGLSFAAYVSWLVDNAVITVDMKDWVDEIRKLGNEVNHEIVVSTMDDAQHLLDFVVMLLRVVYEYPGAARLQLEARVQRRAGNA